MSITKKSIFAMSVLLLPAVAVAQNILVYYGEGGLNEGYSDFGVATGKPIVEQNVLPGILSSFDCIVLPINGLFNPAFSAATLTALNGYVNAGGRIIAEADFGFIPCDRGPGAAMNGLAANLEADLSISCTAIDGGFSTTLNIDPSPFTAGVNSIRYALTSEVVVAVGPHAHSLVRTTNSGITFIAVDKIGSGLFALLGDSNVFSDNSDDGYINHDNGVLAANLCDHVSLETEIEVDIDIKFCNDPNAFNCKKKGVLPVTIFGTDSFDVADIDLGTLQLCLEDLSACTNGPRKWSIADRGDPSSDLGAAMCAVDPLSGLELDYLNPDGNLDLDAVFEASEVQDMLGLFCVQEKGAVSEALIITGSTLDGAPIYSVPFPSTGIEQLWKVNK